MPKPFDATLKELISSYPVDWLTQFGVPVTAPPEVISADLSTVTAAADTLIKVGDLVVHGCRISHVLPPSVRQKGPGQ